MSSSKKLSLTAAIFINLNVMIGTGLFINTYLLSAKAGAAGFLLYPLIGLCMLPLIAVTGKLFGRYPVGGLYAFAKDYSPYLGFLSCWSYFFGKLASAACMLFVATTLLQHIIPILHKIDSMVICLSLLAIFTFLNLLNMKIGMIVQSLFLTAKSIPILFVIISGLLLFDTSHITPDLFIWSAIPLNIPLVLFCFTGFETASALGRNIENPEINGPKAVYYSFGLIMLLYGIFQGFVYMNTFTHLATMSSYKDIFPCLAHKLLTSDVLANKLSTLLYSAVGLSALGGAYGILFSNSWNLYTIAEHNHIFAASYITKLNRFKIPFIAVLIESITCASFLLFNQGSQVPLQRTAALGVVLAYTISAFAYFKLLQKEQASTKDFAISCAAFITCILFVTTCAISFFETGIAPLLLFIAILAKGSAAFVYKNIKKQA